jgi:RNA polymerase sigma-70 factor (ECF subfamily)
MTSTESGTSLSLLELVRNHNQEAWSRLLYLYSPLVAHWCYAWGVQGPDAEDILQEVFQAVARGMPTFRRDQPGHTFRGWLRVIAHRKSLDLFRDRARQPQAEGGSDALLRLQRIPTADESEQLVSEEVRLLHHRALELIRSQFEERTWQAFWQTAVERRSPLDVARDMDMTPAAVRKAKSRVLRRLKEELGDLLG